MCPCTPFTVRARVFLFLLVSVCVPPSLSLSVLVRAPRRLDKLTAGVEEENLGPLEATVRNLSKQITAKAEASDALQHTWLQDQTTLVEAADDVEIKTSKVRRVCCHCWCNCERVCVCPV